MTPMEATNVANAFQQAAVSARAPRPDEPEAAYLERMKTVDIALIVNIIRGSDLMHGHGAAQGLAEVAAALAAA